MVGGGCSWTQCGEPQVEVSWRRRDGALPRSYAVARSQRCCAGSPVTAPKRAWPDRGAIGVSGIALASALAVATANFLWQLGSSSYYVDEALSIDHALPSLGDVLSTVQVHELTPWTYFLGLHEWLYVTGSQAEWVTRLPSALAGIALVGAVYWVGSLLGGRTTGGIAAWLAALSPLVLQYAQQARVYIFVMLAATVTVGALIKTAQGTTNQVRWLLVATVLAVLSLWLSYTGAFVVVPLCIWVATRPTISARRRLLFIGACTAAAAALVPLFIEQARHNGEAAGVPGLTLTTLARLIETPFDGRTNEGLDVARVLGVAVVLASAAALALGAARVRQAEDRSLLLAVALSAPLAIIAISLVGKDVAITRYAAVSAPFMIVMTASAIATAPRPLGAGLLLSALVVAGIGLTRSHQRSGFYLDARGVIDYIQVHRRPGDVVFTPGAGGTDAQLAYYAKRRLLPLPPYMSGRDQAALARAVRDRHRAWIITEVPAQSRRHLIRAATQALAPLHYRPQALRVFSATASVAAIVAVPD